MKVLVVDIGGTHVKIYTTGKRLPRMFPSGPAMTPEQMVCEVQELAEDWTYNVVSMGYPGPVLRGMPVAEPHNLGKGWVSFNFEAAFQHPVKIINDAAMQALGGYKGGRSLFLGLGTGLGSAFVVNGIVEPLELGHLPYKRGTFEDYVGARGLKKYGVKQWRREVAEVVARLIAAMQPDDVLLGGGNTHKLKDLPPRARLIDNSCAFRGGLRLWDEAGSHFERHKPGKAA
jgi:polyphosphate glucokinase